MLLAYRIPVCGKITPVVQQHHSKGTVDDSEKTQGH